MMNTEIFLVLLWMPAISICSSIPIQKNDVIEIPMNKTDDLKGVHPTVLHMRSSTSSNDVITSVPVGDVHVVSTQTYDNTINGDTVNFIRVGDDFTVINSEADEHKDTVQTLHSSTKSRQRAASSCSNLNPEEESLCHHAVLANAKLDHVYNLVSNLIISRLFPLNVHLSSKGVGGDCTMNVSRLASDLRTAVTAVCLLDNVTETTETIGGCCHSNSHIGEEFHLFAVFLQTNVFRFLIKDYQMDTVETVCVGENVNIIWLVRHITSTLQKIKQLITAIESRQCVLPS